LTAVGSARATDLRLAALHLRSGATWLARAELEVLARIDALDPPALADLAVARWRTGDLEGAAAAAEEHLAAGESAGGALVVAAEAAASAGREGEALELVERALAAAGDWAVVDALLGGLPTRAPWPGVGAATVVETAAPALAPGDRLETALAELAADRSDRAAIQLALVLRRDRGLAAAVLDAIADRRSPALDLVRGDALRTVGREADAERAFAAAEAELDR